MCIRDRTNTGKTHLAIERLLGHSSGIIGFPLRLLARENYDRMVLRKGIRNVALITGEEKIVPPRSAIVAFSGAEVYAIAEAVRRRRGGCAVVMGRLSPRTRNAQVALYQDKEIDFLVATDAIGMGLNMDVDHVGFAGISKFDGQRCLLYTSPSPRDRT